MRYAALIKQLPNLCIARTITGDYSETKRAVRDYQIAKRELFEAFRREDLGNWLKKPMEQDEFHLPKWRDLDVDSGVESIDFIVADKLNKRSTSDAINVRNFINVRNYGLKKSVSINHKQKRHDKTLNRIAEQYNGGQIGKKRKSRYVTFKE